MKENFSRKTTDSNNSIQIGGLTPLTTIDYPDALAAVIFLQGCPWRCGYCHNQELLSPGSSLKITWNQIREFLVSRIGLLDAIVFSGGEPTYQKSLVDAMVEVKNLGYNIGLHSAGIYPERLANLLPYIDWIGLDIKTICSEYSTITHCKNSGSRAWKSLEIILNSSVDYEIRTTFDADNISHNHLQQLIDDLQKMGVKNYALQTCRDQSLKPIRNSMNFDKKELIQQYSGRFHQFIIR